VVDGSPTGDPRSSSYRLGLTSSSRGFRRRLSAELVGGQQALAAEQCAGEARVADLHRSYAAHVNQLTTSSPRPRIGADQQA